MLYKRYENLRHWISCWNKCGHYGAELTVIHNVDRWEDKYYWMEPFNGRYLVRANIGYDIGAFQDVCRNRLANFPDWDRLLWVCDDVFPMNTDFVQQFSDSMTTGVAVAVMEISKAVKTHIRTSGFMIDRKVAERLRFPADPITTKRQCYEFEHMGVNAFYEQIIRKGLKVVQVAPNEISPLWDSGYARKLNRQKEHEALFGKMPEQPPFIPKSVHLANEK